MLQLLVQRLNLRPKYSNNALIRPLLLRVVVSCLFMQSLKLLIFTVFLQTLILDQMLILLALKLRALESRLGMFQIALQVLYLCAF